ncbi:hypothetical protein AaE_013899 [Aphanomyces astaci]|uniref:CCHC-type domain-containing protein n=1 Tax=Aphanomyces astaci TaxID=112090 RepID=A0A6A4Z2A5_APHAT|nr:hypothetical protein AaE_013899 [Aphanomyces astaci]
MSMILEEKDLWDVVIGNEKWEDQPDDAARMKFVKRMKKAFAMICLCLDDSQLSLVRTSANAMEAWKRLEDHYEKKTLANKLYLRRKFFSTIMEEGSDMLTHINQLKTLAEQLEAVGAPVSEDDLVITLLCSLSESYDVLITALESRSDALTWEFVKARLLHEEMKRKEQGADGSKSAAFLASKRDKTKKFPCHKCGEKGHWANKCPKRESKPDVAAIANADEHFLFMASLKSHDQLQDEWFIDSGATHHMTNSKEHFVVYSPMEPISVHLANDKTIQAVGKGDIIMELETPHGTQRGLLKDVWYLPKLSRNLFLSANLRPIRTRSALSETAA